MIEQIAAFFTIEMIYLWLNIGVIPFWLILIVFPQSKICGLLVTSVFPFFVLTAVYVYLGYYFYTSGYDFGYNFTLLGCKILLVSYHSWHYRNRH